MVEHLDGEGDLTLLACIGSGAELGPDQAPRAFAATCLPVAGLLRLCSKFHDLHARSFAAPDDTNEWQVLLSWRWEARGVIEGMTPVSPAGRIAKAGVALVLLEENADVGNPSERLAVMKLRDLVGSVQA